MKTKKYLQNILDHQKKYKLLRKKLKNHNLLKTQEAHYLKSDKEDFLELWKDFSHFFHWLQRNIKHLKIRKYFLMYNYNAFILKKHYLVFYFNVIMEMEDIFWDHDDFIRNLLSDNTKKDFSYYAKYIYKPRHITVINTPNVFLKSFETKVSKEVFKLLKPWVIETANHLRLLADYNNLFYYLKYNYDRLMYRVVKKIGTIIAHTKFSNRKKWYITQKNKDKYLECANPWDILLTRWNWNASNIGIPWFWKHMSMYIGTWKYLKKHFPKNYTKDLKSTTHYIIEATWEGVLLKSINEIITTNDYLWVSRTTFSGEKIRRAIGNSFRYIGSQYDFIFNFYSDKNLVCSELIMKSYAKEFKDDEWITIQLEHIWSGLVFPPNNFVKLLHDESMKKKPTVEPFLFIDSLEKTWKNFIATNTDFLESRKRSRFSFGLQ